MSFITIGNALGCTINSHRRGWDGSICKNAETWNCSAKQQFRTDYCQQGDPRCYHIHIFEEGNPAGIKVIFEHLGIAKPFVRLPLMPASNTLKHKIVSFMESVVRVTV